MAVPRRCLKHSMKKSVLLNCSGSSSGAISGSMVSDGYVPGILRSLGISLCRPSGALRTALNHCQFNREWRLLTDRLTRGQSTFACIRSPVTKSHLFDRPLNRFCAHFVTGSRIWSTINMTGPTRESRKRVNAIRNLYRRTRIITKTRPIRADMMSWQML